MRVNRIMKKTNTSSGNNRKFTLIELLVVIAIMGILITMLLPSVLKAKKASETAVCISNQSQLYRAGMLYTHNNKGHIVPAAGPGSYKISFDDYVAEYMNRSLTQTEINEDYINKDVSALKCPSSTIKAWNRRDSTKPASVRSYAMNTGYRWWADTFDGITCVKQELGVSSVIWTLLDTDFLIYSGEIHHIEAAVGYGGASWLGILDDVGQPLHSNLRSSYILVDGHAELMHKSFAINKVRRRKH